MGFNITEDEAVKQQKLLKSSYDMYENTKRETKRVMRDATNDDGTRKYTQKQIDDRIKMINDAQDEIRAKYIQFGGNEEDLSRVATRKRVPLDIEPFYFNDDEDGDIQPQQVTSPHIDLVDNNETEAVEENISSLDKAMKLDGSESNDTTEMPVNALDTRTQSFIPSRDELLNESNFDMVSLPSKGECYREKFDKIPVSYLNAYDENIITAPNLYRDNTVIDTILKRKIMSNTISCDDLLEGDRDAIILFLRATGFGTEYPITAKDNTSGKEFDTVFDLSKLKFKPFNLRGDSNGWFDFKLPVSQKNIKFRFLTHRDMKTLERADEYDNNMIKKDKLSEMADILDFYIESDKKMGSQERVEMRNAVRSINKWSANISEEETEGFTKTFTNHLELSVMSVDGNTDRRFIRKFVREMNIRDSSALRRYIEENEPGIDYNITIDKPESLGGGSLTVFLQIDQYVFLNTSE